MQLHGTVLSVGPSSARSQTPPYRSCRQRHPCLCRLLLVRSGAPLSPAGRLPAPLRPRHAEGPAAARAAAFFPAVGPLHAPLPHLRRLRRAGQVRRLEESVVCQAPLHIVSMLSIGFYALQQEPLQHCVCCTATTCRQGGRPPLLSRVTTSLPLLTRTAAMPVASTTPAPHASHTGAHTLPLDLP